MKNDNGSSNQGCAILAPYRQSTVFIQIYPIGVTTTKLHTVLTVEQKSTDVLPVDAAERVRKAQALRYEAEKRRITTEAAALSERFKAKKLKLVPAEDLARSRSTPPRAVCPTGRC